MNELPGRRKRAARPWGAWSWESGFPPSSAPSCTRFDTVQQSLYLTLATPLQHQGSSTSQPALSPSRMLSSLASLPSGVASFVSNRRKTFTWVAGTVGGAYLLGQWGMKRIGDMAERARQESADKDK